MALNVELAARVTVDAPTPQTSPNREGQPGK